MEDSVLEKLRYPIGRFSPPIEYSPADKAKWINILDELSSMLRSELADFNEEMLNTPYRPGGWSARQVVHHLADSHINAYIRFKLTLTEELPTIRPYKEADWAELQDSKTAAPGLSLNLLEALHKRWVEILKNMNDQDFERKYYHPESKKEFTLVAALALYAWHSMHHLSHIKIVKSKFALA